MEIKYLRPTSQLKQTTNNGCQNPAHRYVTPQLEVFDISNVYIGLIPGDGIGKEVIPAGRRILEALPASSS